MPDKSPSKPIIKKSITVISRSAPYGRNNSRLCLDMALAYAVFEQNVNYVFLDDGVYQLLQGQNAATINSKTMLNALETLELYGIENVCVDEDSLRQRKLKAEDLLQGIKLVDSESLSQLLSESDCVFNL